MSINFHELFPCCEVVSVQNKPYLFSNMRIDRKTIPDNLYAYDVRDDCDGQFWQIQKFVMVNHWGTICGMEPVDLDDRGQYWCPPEEADPDMSSEGYFLDEIIESPDDFRNRYISIKSTI